MVKFCIQTITSHILLFNFVYRLVECQNELIFTKTLEGEIFRTDLVPSLTKNVSYISAIDVNKNPVFFSTNSSFFTIDNYNGNVYLISKLIPNFYQSQIVQLIDITVSNGISKFSIKNRIIILNSNDRPPEFIDTQRVFEIQEDNNFPDNVKYKNGTVFELNVRNPFPINEEISVYCENTLNYPKACDTFGFSKDISKSTNNNWFGKLKILKRLNYLKQSIYQFIAVATNSPNNTKRIVIEVRVLPNFNKAAQLSSSSYFFTVLEKQPPHTFIGQLRLSDEYEAPLKALYSFELVYASKELLNNGILYQDLLDVDFNLVKTYLQIDSENKLYTLSVINRDSIEFSNLNGIFKTWIKVYNIVNPQIASFYKITIVIIDVNDNDPKFGIINNYIPYNTFLPIEATNNLATLISENEIGPVIFDDVNPLDNSKQYFAFYDFDLGENSTFELTINQALNETTLSECSYAQLVNYFAFSSINSKIFNSKTSLNLIINKPIDFDDLNLTPFINSNTGIGHKFLKFNIFSKEIESKELLRSKFIPITLTIQDTNDNRPILSQETYYAYVNKIETDFKLLPQLITQFEIADKDLGVYGIAGLVCSLLGDGSEKFFVDTVQQKVFLKMCNPSCSINNYKSVYYLTLLCKDNKGKGNVAFGTLIVSFKNAYRTNFKITNQVYYLLASGPNGIEIPSLVIKPLNLDPSNRITYFIQNIELQKLFSIDEAGNFKIIAKQLRFEQTVNGNGTFIVPIYISDNQGNSNYVTIIVQLSNLFKQLRCPQIVESAMCRFSINRTSFDPNRIRFCFYGANPTVINYNTNPNQFYNQIIYSLLPNSPNFLYINPYDGCVKILPHFNLEDSTQTFIQYSVGAFNPGFPECTSVNQRSCIITIDNQEKKQIKCIKKYQNIDNSTSHKLEIFSPDVNTIIDFSIIREERTTFDGNYEIVTNALNTFFKVSPGGLIKLNPQLNLTNYQSVLVVVKIQDLLQNSKSTECLVDFRFCNLNSKLPKFIGFGLRYENLCEDVPESSQIMSLKAFDPSQSMKTLCFSLIANDYFSLISSKDEPTSNGDIYLKKKIDLKTIKSTNGNTYLNFTALLTYCNHPLILNKQIVNINVLNVNKYAPQLKLLSPKVVISLRNLGPNSNPSFNVFDEDISPYDYFNCVVENDQNFVLLNNNDQRKIYLTYKNLLDQRDHYSSYKDISIKCCDDEKYWTENNCFSVPKCSLTPLRVEFVDFLTPIYCANDQQLTYLAENAPVPSQVTIVTCTSNYTEKGITYQLLTNTNYFSINSNGIITLENSVSNLGFGKQNLQIQCSNGLLTSICQINLVIIPLTDYRPVWLYPNPNTVKNCISILDNAPIDSLVAIVKATVFNSNATIIYSFVNNVLMIDSIFEFKFKNQLIGEIYLTKKLNRSDTIQRELTLAATVRRNTDQMLITTYQYLCINILPSSFQPCFRNKPDNSKWPYQINLKASDDACYYDQIVKIFNQDFLTPSVYYYIISPKNSTDNVYSKLTLNPKSGLLCKNITTINLIKNIAESTLNYTDEFNNICYNLLLFASTRELNSTDLNVIQYDSSNCSFNYLKLCFGKDEYNIYAPKFTQDTCLSVISLDQIPLMDTKCLCELKLEKKIENKNLYDYTLTSTNQFDKSIFNVNKTIDCLSVKLASGISKNFYLGKHTLNITVFDNNNNSDLKTYDVYICQSCAQKSFTYVQLNSHAVNKDIQKYINYLSEKSTNILQKSVQALIHGVYDAPNLNDKYLESKFKDSNTIIEVSFFDNLNSKFVNNDEIIPLLNKQINEINAKNLGINEITASCSTVLQDSILGRSIGIGLISAAISLFFFIFPLLILCALCMFFKKLKYQDNRIIMKEKVIPIIKSMNNEITPSRAVQCENNRYRQAPQCSKSSGDFNLDEIISEPMENNIMSYRPNDLDKAFDSRFGINTFKSGSAFKKYDQKPDASSQKDANPSIIIREAYKPIKEEKSKINDQFYDTVTLNPNISAIEKTDILCNKEPIGETVVVSINDYDHGDFIFDDQSEKESDSIRKTPRENLIM